MAQQKALEMALASAKRAPKFCSELLVWSRVHVCVAAMASESDSVKWSQAQMATSSSRQAKEKHQHLPL